MKDWLKEALKVLVSVAVSTAISTSVVVNINIQRFDQQERKVRALENSLKKAALKVDEDH